MAKKGKDMSGREDVDAMSETPGMPDAPHGDPPPWENQTGPDTAPPPAVVQVQPLALQWMSEFPMRGDIDGVYCSLDLKRPGAMSILLRASQVSDLQGKKDAGIVLPVSDVLMYRKEVTDEEDGEVREATVIVFLSPDGRTMSTTGDYILGGLRQLVAIYRPPPWNPPLPLRLRPWRTNRGREMLILDLVEIQTEGGQS